MKSALLIFSTAAALLIAPDPSSAQATAELDAYWAEVSRTVREGNFEAYATLYHADAVLVSTNSGQSLPIAQALEGWKQSFLDTRDGRTKADVSFRFTQRLHDETTAHETGILRYKLESSDGSTSVSTVHFQALLVRKEERWLMLMEHQQGEATPAEWKAANPPG